MPEHLLYFLIAIGATIAGAMTGMGGGVIMKPVLDLLHSFDVQTVGVLSAITVFSMSIVSIGKQMLSRSKIPFDTAIPLALGSVVGGVLGQQLLSAIVTYLALDPLVTMIQNILLALLILAVYLYMRNKHKIKGFTLRGIPVSILVGVFLGICSSFLGIGGGPINVALIIYLFSYDTKTATVCSLLTIFFAQASKLAMVACSTGFAAYDLTMAPAMVLGAIIGGFVGTCCQKSCSEKTVETAFNAVQLLVFAIAIYNVFKNILL
ncbi:MAG: sulfite exporter TauE/SafE family protein [Pseudoflavonifractor sp.]